MIRASGLLAWYLLIGDVLIGTMISGGVARVTLAYPRKFLTHRVLGWALLAAVATHIALILALHYKGWGLFQVALPSASGPLSRILGVTAAWLLIITLGLAVVKGHIPNRVWHWIHRRLPFTVLVLGTAHGVLAGGIRQGTELPVILPAVVALTLLASVCVVRANVTATRRRSLLVRTGQVTERISILRRYSSQIRSLYKAYVGGLRHESKPTRKERQARSIRIIFWFASVLTVFVLVLAADQFGATGFRGFITRQGGVGATPDTRNCGHLNECSTPGATSNGRLVADPARRHKHDAPSKRTHAHVGGTPAAASAPAPTSDAARSLKETTTTTTTERPTSTRVAKGATPISQSPHTPALIPAIRGTSSAATLTPSSTTTTTTTEVSQTTATLPEISRRSATARSSTPASHRFRPMTTQSPTRNIGTGRDGPKAEDEGHPAS
jgi:hypothetical protein